MALALPSASPFLVYSTANLPSDSASPSWELRSGQPDRVRRLVGWIDGMGWRRNGSIMDLCAVQYSTAKDLRIARSTSSVSLICFLISSS